MRNSNQLTARAVSSKKEPGRYGDGGGLYLQVSKFGTKSWIYRYMLDGRARHMGLGAIDLVSLAEARDTARECRKLLREGNDPIEARNANLMARRLEASKSITFKECAEKYIDTNEAGWSNPKHRKQWRSTLETYAYPVIGDFSAAAVDTDLVLKILEPIWSAKPETASRVRGRIENILDWATVLKYREGDNPARWRGNLNKLLPPTSKVRRTKHHEALPYEQLPDFMHDLWAREGTSALALEFLILTAARTSEVINATWAEIDSDNNYWTIAADRMKSNRQHRVPLCERTVEILRSLPREDGNEHVFIGPSAGKGLSNMAMSKLLRRMGRDNITVHGFRSTFRDWVAERTAYPNEVAEMALAHVISDKTEEAYRRGDLFEKRRRLMDDWAKYAETEPHDTGAVVAIRGQADD